jgi:predicted GTPase
VSSWQLDSECLTLVIDFNFGNIYYLGQFVTNAKGEKTSVLVPYKEWDALNKEREELKHKLEEAELSLRYKQASKEAKLFEQGKLNTYPISKLLDQL